MRDFALVRALLAAVRVILLLTLGNLRDLPDELHLELPAQLNDRVTCLVLTESLLVYQSCSIAVEMTQWTMSEHLDQMRVAHGQDFGDLRGHVAYYDVARRR